jgi:cystathionine gamma-synthase
MEGDAAVAGRDNSITAEERPGEPARPRWGLRPQTLLVREGRPDRSGEPLNLPVILASTFRAGDPGTSAVSREYCRDDGTPAWEALEDLVGRLEGGPAVAFSSGMAAIAAVLELLPAGARVVIPADCYPGCAHWYLMAPPSGAGSCGLWTSRAEVTCAARWRAPTCSGWRPRAIRCWN